MNLIEFYDQVGGNYQAATARLPESLLTKLLAMFLNDKSIEELNIGIKENDGEKAFRAIHTLKGVCLNLDFKKLGDAAIELTEKLRDRKLANYEVEYQKVITEYEAVITAIKNLN